MPGKREEWADMEDEHYTLEIDERLRANGAPRKLASIARSMSQRAAQVTFISQAGKEIWTIFLGSWMNLMLLAIPFAIVAKYAGWGDGAAFSLALIGLCPLAERLGFITEQLAMYTNDSIGGLLNASFGNATELIMAVFALKDGLLRVVQLTLLGSVLSNLLLVLGTSFFVGGIAQKQQRFNQQGVNVNCGLLVLACIAVALPSLLSETGTAVGHGTNAQIRSEVKLSRLESVFLLCCYLMYLLFQLCTHRHLFEMAESEDGEANGAEAATPDAAALPDARVLSETALSPRASIHHSHHAEMELMPPPPPQAPIFRTTGSRRLTAADSPHLEAQASLVRETVKAHDDEAEEKELSWPGCLVWVSLTTAMIAYLSEIIVGSVQNSAKDLGIPLPFLVTIILPIMGNAAEHMGAVYFAWRNRIEISIGIAVGSATQVAVLVMPLCVVVSWMMGRPLDLNFNTFESGALWISTLLTVICLQDGYGNWMKGSLLVLTFAFVSAGFWWHADKDLKEGEM